MRFTDRHLLFIFPSWFFLKIVFTLNVFLLHSIEKNGNGRRFSFLFFCTCRSSFFLSIECRFLWFIQVNLWIALCRVEPVLFSCILFHWRSHQGPFLFSPIWNSCFIFSNFFQFIFIHCCNRFSVLSFIEANLTFYFIFNLCRFCYRLWSALGYCGHLWYISKT